MHVTGLMTRTSASFVTGELMLFMSLAVQLVVFVVGSTIASVMVGGEQKFKGEKAGAGCVGPKWFGKCGRARGVEERQLRQCVLGVFIISNQPFLFLMNLCAPSARLLLITSCCVVLSSLASCVGCGRVTCRDRRPAPHQGALSYHWYCGHLGGPKHRQRAPRELHDHPLCGHAERDDDVLQRRRCAQHAHHRDPYGHGH